MAACAPNNFSIPARSSVTVSAAVSSTRGENSCAQRTSAALAAASLCAQRLRNSTASRWAISVRDMPSSTPKSRAFSLQQTTESSGYLPSTTATALSRSPGSARMAACVLKSGTYRQANMASCPARQKFGLDLAAGGRLAQMLCARDFYFYFHAAQQAGVRHFFFWRLLPLHAFSVQAQHQRGRICRTRLRAKRHQCRLGVLYRTAKAEPGRERDAPHRLHCEPGHIERDQTEAPRFEQHLGGFQRLLDGLHLRVGSAAHP